MGVGGGKSTEYVTMSGVPAPVERVSEDRCKVVPILCTRGCMPRRPSRFDIRLVSGGRIHLRILMSVGVRQLEGV